MLRDFAERYGVEEKRSAGRSTGGARRVQQSNMVPPEMAPPDVDEMDFDAGAVQSRHPRAGQSSAHEMMDEQWFHNPPPRRPPVSVTRRVMARVMFALGLMMCAGAVSLIVFAPPAERRASDLAASTQDDAASSGVSVVSSPLAAIEPVPAKEEIGGQSSEGQGNAGQNNASQGSAGRGGAVKAAALAGEPRTIPEGGVTVLRPRLAAPVTTGSVSRTAEFDTPRPASPEAARGGSLGAAGGQIDRQFASTAPAPAVPAPVVMFAPQPQPQPANETLSRLIALAPDAGAANQQSPSGGRQSGQLAVTAPVARATTYVNMRAGPDNGEAVVAVVPAEAELEVVECTNWCEVMFEGQRGWIYSKFVERTFAPRSSGNG
ncbi:MAG: SH3 domain-containing protein [Rhizobiales bacterium]|nr:SH3 domain-containing protein [Hyphomicrobiales bacterium]